MNAQAGPPLQKFVDSGRIPPGIKKKIDEGRVAEILVTLEASDIRNYARSKRNERGLKVNDRKILSEKAQRYSKKKNTVLGSISQDDMVVENDYENFPILHMRVNEQGLRKLMEMDEV